MALIVYTIFGCFVVVPTYVVQFIASESLKDVYLNHMTLVNVILIIRGVARLSLEVFMYYMFDRSFKFFLE